MLNIILQYIDLAIKNERLRQQGDYLNGNKNHLKIKKVVDEIAKSSLDVKLEFYKLLNHSNPSVRLWTAIELLGTDEEKSKSVTNEKGIVGLDAKTILDIWKNGMIKKSNWNDFTDN